MSIKWTIFITHEKTCEKLKKAMPLPELFEQRYNGKEAICQWLYRGWQTGIIGIEKYTEMWDSIERQYHSFDLPSPYL